MPLDKQNLAPKIKWQVPEYRRHQRDRVWYIGAGIFLFLCLFFSFFAFSNWNIVFLGANSNFLFALIVIIISIIFVVNDGRDPLLVDVSLESEGVMVGRRFYDYDEFKNFCVLYKPKQSLKNLYFEFKSPTKQRLSLPLRRLDALTVRNYLIRYLDEDLERTDMPLSEQLTKLFKL